MTDAYDKIQNLNSKSDHSREMITLAFDALAFVGVVTA